MGWISLFNDPENNMIGLAPGAASDAVERAAPQKAGGRRRQRRCQGRAQAQQGATAKKAKRGRRR